LTLPNAAVTGDLLAATGTNAVGTIAAVAAGSYLRAAGTGTLPIWSTLTLPNAATQGDLIVATGTNALGSVADVGTGQVLTSGGIGAVPVYSATPTLTDLTLTGQAKLASGTAAATSLFFTADGQTAGWFRGAANAWDWGNASAVRFRLSSTASGGKVEILGGTADGLLGFGTIGSVDVLLGRDAANILKLSNGTTAQTMRIYGTSTGPKYLSLSHDGTDGVVDTAASSGKLKLGGNASDMQFGKALVALGGGVAPTLGTIGGSGPATAAQNTWMRWLDSSGAAFWVPAWK
jgi:hypothetical protein